MGDRELTTYTFYFVDGTFQTGDGISVGDAFSNLGHSQEEIATVDIFEESAPSGVYIYNEDTKTWDTVAV